MSKKKTGPKRKRKPQSEKIVLTEEDKKLILLAASRGYTNDEIAGLMGCSAEPLMKLLAKLDIRRNELARARAKAGLHVTNKLFQEIDKGNFPAIKFYCQTRLGMRTTDRVEITGADGKPIATNATVKEVSRDDVLKQIQAIQKRMQEKYE